MTDDMANDSFTDAELTAYLDEALSPPDMATVEQALREHPGLVNQLAAINRRRDAGAHSLGEIWRRNRISCPTREQLGTYLLEVLEDDRAEYIKFHLETIGCRLCLANLNDLEQQKADYASTSENRRTRYFESSAGYLKKK